MIGLAHVRAGLLGAAAIPAFLISFQNGALDPRVSFTRASQATLFDATGRLTFAPNNIVTRSEEINLWSKVNSTVIANTYASPVGSVTADTITQTAATGDQVYSPSIAWHLGAAHIVSIWARSASGTKKFRLKFNDTSTNQYSVDFTATSLWQRFWFKTAAALGSGYMAVAACAAGEAGDLIVWGAQAEAVTYQTTPGAYVATTTAAYYGPRFDYDPVTLALRGLLIEEARTNTSLQSQFASGWTPESTTLASNFALAPDGSTTAALISDGAGTARHIVYCVAGVAANKANTVSIFLKDVSRRYVQVAAVGQAVNNAAFVYVDLQTGAITDAGSSSTPLMYIASRITPAGGGWHRVELTFNPGTQGTIYYVITASDRSVHASGALSAYSPSYTGSNKQFLAWGAQLEAGSPASGYIPTTLGSVARAADIARLTPPAGASSLRFTFDDTSTQDMSFLSGVEYTIPTTLARQRIKSIR